MAVKSQSEFDAEWREVTVQITEFRTQEERATKAREGVMRNWGQVANPLLARAKGRWALERL